MDIDRYRKLAGIDTVQRRVVVVESLSAPIEGVIKKLAKKTKIGDYDMRLVHQALAAVEPGWKLDLVVGLVPMREGSLNKTMREPATARAWAESKGLMDAYFTYYNPTTASFHLMYGPNLNPEKAKGKQLRKEAPSKAELDSLIKDFLDTLLSNTIQEKDPKNPVEGKFYINPIGKPKIEDELIPPHLVEYYGEGTRSVTVSWKFSGVRRAVQAFRLTSPTGQHIDIEDSEASLWTWLYKTDIATKAQKFIDDEGIVAKDAAKKAMKGFSKNDVVGTCGICHNIQKLQQGKLVLHGYTRPGYGWIQGSCFGVKYQPWELSPKAVEDYIKQLDTWIPATKADLGDVKRQTEVSVYIDDHNFSPLNGYGYRRYKVTKDAFKVTDDKKLTYKEVTNSGGTTASPWALDSKNAEKVFKEVKDRMVQRVETTLKQMEQTRKELSQAVLSWKLAPLPGAALENTMSDMRRLAGIKES